MDRKKETFNHRPSVELYHAKKKMKRKEKGNF